MIPLVVSSRSSSSRGWLITVYYTAVEEYHNGKVVKVTGCPGLNCSNGSADLGSYPEDFVKAVKDEGTGRTRAGTYLNWSYDIGYWMDSAPRNSTGNALRPLVSAAADRSVLAANTRFTIAGCGHDDQGDPLDEQVCAQLKAAKWEIDDEFTPGFGGSKHLDVYLGEETGPGFTESPWYCTLTGATILIH